MHQKLFHRFFRTSSYAFFRVYFRLFIDATQNTKTSSRNSQVFFFRILLLGFNKLLHVPKIFKAIPSINTADIFSGSPSRIYPKQILRISLFLVYVLDRSLKFLKKYLKYLQKELHKNFWNILENIYFETCLKNSGKYFQ